MFIVKGRLFSVYDAKITIRLSDYLSKAKYAKITCERNSLYESLKGLIDSVVEVKFSRLINARQSSDEYFITAAEIVEIKIS